MTQTTGSSSVVLFLVDGMRPDGLQAADTPFLDSVIAEGASTFRARTVVPSSTLPCHTSLFLGVEPARHGITTNTWSPPVRPIPGLIETLQKGGKTATFFTNWEPLRDLSPPETLHAAYFMNTFEDEDGDNRLAKLATQRLRLDPTAFAFVYLGFTDTAGHRHGWMSEPYLRAIANADRCIATVCAALPSDSTILVTADHGGHDKTHGTASDEDTTIPLLLRGPNIPTGHTITRSVAITDIAPTITRLFGLDAPKEWIGSPIAFDKV